MPAALHQVQGSIFNSCRALTRLCACRNHDGLIDLDEFVAGYDKYMTLVRTGQFLGSRRELKPTHFLKTNDRIPTDTRLVSNWCGGTIKLHKATYEANDPSEDRSTLAVGEDFLFCGVWDGHGGTACSDFSEVRIFENFQRALADPRCAGVQDAFAYSYIATDGEYLDYAGSDPTALFAGTCAVGAYIDLNSTSVSVSNLGDSRAVLGLLKVNELVCVPMSNDHTAADENEKARYVACIFSRRVVLVVTSARRHGGAG
jgi:hypothetical protein